MVKDYSTSQGPSFQIILLQTTFTLCGTFTPSTHGLTDSVGFSIQLLTQGLGTNGLTEEGRQWHMQYTKIRLVHNQFHNPSLKAGC